MNSSELSADKNIIKRTEMLGKEVSQLINPHLLQFEDVFIKDKNIIYYVDAVDLLNKNRIDIVIKYLYTKFKMLKLDSDWGIKLYLDHIQKLNGFFEGDGSGKIGKDVFLDRFDTVIDQIKDKGFNPEISIIPIDKNFTIIDGSHRVGASLINNQELPCLYLDEYSAFEFSFKKLQSTGCSENIQDAIALEYIKFKTNTYIITIFPVGKGKDKQIQSILDQYCDTVYSKNIFFSNRKDTHTQLIRELYFKDNWIGDWENKFRGAKLKGQACFKTQGKVKVFLIEANDISVVREIKIQIRKIFGGLQDCVHINDDHEETVRLAEIYFNKNSIHLINTANLVEDTLFERLIYEFKKWADENTINTDYCCIDGSGVLSLYGIRSANDLDIIHHQSLEIGSPNHKINSHNVESRYHSKSIDEIIFNPDNYLYYSGLKFVSLTVLKSMKTNRNEGKDIEDINLINRKLGANYNTRILRNYYLKKTLMLPDLLKLKRNTKKILGKVKRKFQKIFIYKPKLIIASFIDSFKPYIRTIQYCGFKVFYSKGTSLIEINGYPPVRIGGVYEKKESQILISWLQQSHSERPLFIDIGANIGLISLNILSSVKNVRIYAFEPGEHQAELIKKTIQENNLEQQVILQKQALSKKQGKALFHIHKSNDSSGDGLFDTLRAGTTESVEVELQTLDNWWQSLNYPMVDVIKIDTEGAELWVLEGGIEMITHCQPRILLEINSKNLSAYPYDADNILSWFGTNKYILRTPTGLPVNFDNYNKLLLDHETFQALPM